MTAYFFKLAWKNLWRSPRRTLLTANAIAVGVMALVFMRNYYDTFHEHLIKNVIRFQGGHLVVTAPRFHEKEVGGLFLKNPSLVDKWVSKEKAVRASSHRIFLQGLLSSPYGSANVAFMGVNPDREKQLTVFHQRIKEGSFFHNDQRNGIVVGVGIAKKLKLSVGSKVVILTQGIDGSIGNELLNVAGIFDTQSDYDKSFALIKIETARQLLSLPSNAIHQIAIALKADTLAEATQLRFQRKFEKRRDVEMLTWKTLHKPLMGMVELNQSVNRLLMIIILFVASLGIINSVTMSLLERTREFGVMFSIGTQKSEAVLLVLFETILLCALGVFFGNVLGLSATLFFGAHGFDLAWLTSNRIAVSGIFLDTVTYPTVRWHNSLTVSLTIFLLSSTVVFIPIRFILRLKPIQALRAT